MAKESVKTREDDEQAPPPKQTMATNRTAAQEDDERKDRERLRKEHEERTPEKLSELKTELSKLKMQFEADVTRLRDEFAGKKAELEQQMGGYSNAPVVPAGPQPSNETLADGSPRRTLNIQVTA